MAPLLQLDNLSIGFGLSGDGQLVVQNLTVSLQAGEVLALVGESGSGKTMVSRAILRLLPPGGAIAGGRILFRGRDLATVPAAELRDIRGAQIGMVFQEPMTSLNPALTVGFQMKEALQRHFGLADAECRRRAIGMLTRVGLADPEGALCKYPHEFSGGMRQRILLASVLLLEPALLIADEPTTALDVLVQKQVMDIMLDIVHERGISVLLITHDLGLVATYADRVAVMRRGQLMESGTVSDILLNPRHEYTRHLLESLPRRTAGTVATASQRQPACIADELVIRYRGRRLWPWRRAPVFEAVKGVSLTVGAGETLVVVGESGSGKTTLARALLGLLPIDGGRVLHRDQDISELNAKGLRLLRRRMQMIFQDPYSALDPRMSVLDIVIEGLRHTPGLNREARRLAALGMLAEVGLDQDFAARFPHELSGGQRQRVNIARALVSEPEFVVADEPVSALDITVQAEILELFHQLQRRRGFSCLFITHDLSVAAQIADRVAVMFRGRIVEQGDRDQIFDCPLHPYTCELLTASPNLVHSDGGGYRLLDARFEPQAAPVGYTYGDWRAPDFFGLLVETRPGHSVACRPVTDAQHIPSTCEDKSR